MSLPAKERTLDPAVFARAVEWLNAYRLALPGMPVRSPAAPGDVLATLPSQPPLLGIADGRDSWDSVFADLDRIVLPALTHWQHPRFFAYFPANASPPAILGELLSAGLGVQGMLWITSPACTELETRMLDWLAEALDLPSMFRSTSGAGGGVIQGTASEAALVAIVAARDRLRRAWRAAGRPGVPEPVVYASTQAHSSIAKAAMIAGIAESHDDRRHIRLIDTDASYALRPDLLAQALRDDLASGLAPCFVCATIGTTGTTAVDPTAAIADTIADAWHRGAASTAGLPAPWLHADAAYAGSALICPEFRHLAAGLDRCDSLCFNPHKWLLTNFDCSAFYLRDRRPVVDALSITPEYLRNTATDAGSVIDYRDWQVPLGRRFRALKLWLVLRYFGVEGIRQHIRRDVALAELFESLVRADDRFEITAPRVLNLVCFRLRRGGDDANRRLLDAVNATGRAFLTHAVLPDPPAGPAGLTLRLVTGSPATTESDVRETWELLLRLADQLDDDSCPRR